jgi:VWFA-related protein
VEVDPQFPLSVQTLSSAVSSAKTRLAVLVLGTVALFPRWASAQEVPVRITLKPQGLVHGQLLVPVTTAPPVERVELSINGVKYGEARGRSVVIPVHVGEYIRRLRIRVTGFDAGNAVAGEDEMVVNDPRPPFRLRLRGPAGIPQAGVVPLDASIIKPPEMEIARVDFFVGESLVGSSTAPPYSATFDASAHPGALYARAVARSAAGDEANDVWFFGEQPRDAIDVTIQQVPLSVASGPPPSLADMALIDDGSPKKIESLVPASDQPLNVILLIDASESMLEELPVVRNAAKQFVQALIRPADRIAVVAFNQQVYWLTPFTHDPQVVAAAVDRIQSRGETHLYDTAIEMLFELQKLPGRRALVVLTDGVDQGSVFKLDHLVHYAKYSGVPVYPIIKNRLLSKMMRFGIGLLEVRRLANIARDTGATYFIIRRESELPMVYGRLSAELRQQYLMLFYSDPSLQDQWHPLAVSEPGRTLRVPSGYFP